MAEAYNAIVKAQQLITRAVDYRTIVLRLYTKYNPKLAPHVAELLSGPEFSHSAAEAYVGVREQYEGIAAVAPPSDDALSLADPHTQWEDYMIAFTERVAKGYDPTMDITTFEDAVILATEMTFQDAYTTPHDVYALASAMFLLRNRAGGAARNTHTECYSTLTQMAQSNAVQRGVIQSLLYKIKELNQRLQQKEMGGRVSASPQTKERNGTVKHNNMISPPFGSSVGGSYPSPPITIQLHIERDL
jgi:hypothetical protein